MEEITKETMEQYEKIRQSGLTDMFDYYNVIRIADAMEFHSLASLTRDEYKVLLTNFSALMKKYGIKQN